MRRLTSGLAVALTLALVAAGSWPMAAAAAEEHGKPEKGGEAAKPEKGGEKEKGKGEKGKGEKDAKAGPPVSLGMYYEVPELAANLSTSTKKPIYLKLTLSLQMANETDRPKLDAMIPLIVDGFQNYLRELRVEDLAGSMGVYRMREELLIRAATIALPVEIKDVLFKEMLVR